MCDNLNWAAQNLWVGRGLDIAGLETAGPSLDDRERESEREFIGTNIKQFHAKIKLRRWDTEKNLQNRLSCRAPLESFINFYRGLKLMAELVRI